jgi:hypothetical protein
VSTCLDLLKNPSSVFYLIQSQGLLQDTVHMCVKEQVTIFLYTIGHNVKNRLVGTNFSRSSDR